MAYQYFDQLEYSCPDSALRAPNRISTVPEIQRIWVSDVYLQKNDAMEIVIFRWFLSCFFFWTSLFELLSLVDLCQCHKATESISAYDTYHFYVKWLAGVMWTVTGGAFYADGVMKLRKDEPENPFWKDRFPRPWAIWSSRGLRPGAKFYQNIWKHIWFNHGKSIMV